MSFVPYTSSIRFGLPLGSPWESYLASMQAIFTPTGWKGDGTETMVLFSMGSGSNWNSCFEKDLVTPIVRTILATGAGVAVSPFGGDMYGNATAMTQITNLADYVTGPDVRAHPKLGLAGFSMGGQNVLAWAGNNPARTAFVWGAAPLVDVGAYDGVPQLEAAYEGGWDEATYGAVSNPKTMAAAGKYAGLQMKIAYSSNDPVLSPASTIAFAAAVGTVPINLGPLGHDWNVPNSPEAIGALIELLI